MLAEQILEAESVDGVRVPAADLHDPVVTIGAAKRWISRRHLANEPRVAILVDELHLDDSRGARAIATPK